MTKKNEMVDAILKEMTLRQESLKNEQIESIYFGGGTPSILDSHQIMRLIQQCKSLFEVKPDAEITLEANPDDLDEAKLTGLISAGVNRLSIGIQTFDDDRLKLINRVHSSKEALHSFALARKVGFENISADLIYALPPDSMTYWERDLHQMLELAPDHISLYGLTVEEKTVLGNWARKGMFQQVADEMAADQHELAIQLLPAKGYEHYEVSNFAKPGYHSRHNTAYWEDKKYLGLGPGAHSYDGENRAFNISHNAKYLTSINAGVLPLTVENLTLQERMNDYVFTHLRTKKGLPGADFELKFNRDFLEDFQSEINQLADSGLAQLKENVFTLTSQGLMIADEISLRLFYDE